MDNSIDRRYNYGIDLNPHSIDVVDCRPTRNANAQRIRVVSGTSKCDKYEIRGLLLHFTEFVGVSNHVTVYRLLYLRDDFT